MATSVLTIIQDLSRAQEHEWVIKYLDRDLIGMEFALINSQGSAMSAFLEKEHIPVYHFTYGGKKELPLLTFRIAQLLRRRKYRVVHTHLFEASLAGLTAARLTGIHNRVYTRHYSDYHHVWFPSAVKYDRYLNHMATDIIATSENVKAVLTDREQVNPEKIHLVRHGIDMDEYQEGAVHPDRVMHLREKYKLGSAGPVIGAISRFTELKGLQHLIPAFEKVLQRYPDAVLVMANASGDFEKEIRNLLQKIPAHAYRTIRFENDIAALYRLFDCFVHIPVNRTAEAFGQTYLESLASAVPSVFTLSGVAPEFVQDGEHALVVPYADPDAVEAALMKILENPAPFREMAVRGSRTVARLFNVREKVRKLEQIYLKAL